MRMLQTCYTKKIFLGAFIASCLALLSACASSPPANKPIEASTTSTGASDATATNGANDLSTKTVVPEGFGKFLGIFTPYRVTIQQGNFVSKEMVEQVKLGMTREQVRFLLGTALLTDMFHADRWDYVFRLLKPSGELTTSRVTVFFEKSLVAKIDRGDLPNEQEYLKRITDAAILDVIQHKEGKADKPKPKNDE